MQIRLTAVVFLGTSAMACATPEGEDSTGNSGPDALDTAGIEDSDEGGEEGGDEGSDDGGDEGGTDEPGGGTDAFAPIEGEWTTLDEYLPLDDCNMGDWVSDGPGGVLVLSTAGSDGLEISHDHGTEECTFDEAGFECLTRQSEDTTAEEDYGLDALILLELSATGEFDGRNSLQMETHIVANCQGDDCWMVELATAAFPCEMQVVLEAEAD